jgi:hypothetical protein
LLSDFTARPRLIEAAVAITGLEAFFGPLAGIELHLLFRRDR